MLARELKRGEAYMGPDQDDEREEDDGEGNSPDGGMYTCPCCDRTESAWFWCGTCSTGAMQGQPA